MREGLPGFPTSTCRARLVLARDPGVLPVVPCREHAEGPSMGTAGDGSPASGGRSVNGRFSYGFASSPGKRASMEDFYEARTDQIDGETVGLFGVYDGHGGARAAEYVKQHLFSNLIKHPKFFSDTNAAITETYNHTDSEFLKADSTQTRDAGSTASTAIIVGDRLIVANVGDSRAVISKGGEGFQASRIPLILATCMMFLILTCSYCGFQGSQT